MSHAVISKKIKTKKREGQNKKERSMVLGLAKRRNIPKKGPKRFAKHNWNISIIHATRKFQGTVICMCSYFYCGYDIPGCTEFSKRLCITMKSHFYVLNSYNFFLVFFPF